MPPPRRPPEIDAELPVIRPQGRIRILNEEGRLFIAENGGAAGSEVE